MRSRSRLATIAAVPLLVAATVGCGSDDAGNTDDLPVSAGSVDSATTLAGATSEDRFPSVVEVATTYNDDGTFDFAVTLTSPYDSGDRYADGWRVVGPDGTVYGTHTLTHDHASEQPFTRTQPNVEIPDDVAEVTIEGRDLVNGFGGATQSVELVRA